MKQSGARDGPKAANNRSVSEVDKHIGAQVRRHRLAAHMSQEQLATKIGVTFQQVQKYEKGVNRVSASTLFDIANSLSANVLDFLPNSMDAARTPLKPPPSDPRTLALIDVFGHLQSKQSQRLVLQLAEHLVTLEENLLK